MSSGAAQTHALRRSIQKLAIGVARDVARSADRQQPNKVTERTEEFQIKASGIAADYPAWVTGEIPFQNAYTQAVGLRTSELVRPQVSVGFEQSVGAGLSASPRLVPVMASLVVIDWHFTPEDAIDGCTFACSALAPGDEVQFQGFYHLTIAGYGAPILDQDTRD